MAFAYDRAHLDLILPGIRIDGIDVGGMARGQAINVVTARADHALSTPIMVGAAQRTWTRSVEELGVRAQVSQAVSQALSATNDVRWVRRVYDRLTNTPLDRSFDIHYRVLGGPIRDFLSQVAVAEKVSPQDAAIVPSPKGAGVTMQHAQPGRELDVVRATTALESALATGAEQVTLPLQRVMPRVTDARLGKTITVSLSTNTLHLYDGFRVVKSYPVATAMQGFTTPVGVWRVVVKDLHPSWTNPAPTGWAAGMPSFIPPGPDNPLGLRALGLNAPGIFIHGTPESWSIGTYASHGCIRMFESNAMQLFPLVPEGTPVIIYGSPPWGQGSGGGRVGP